MLSKLFPESDSTKRPGRALRHVSETPQRVGGEDPAHSGAAVAVLELVDLELGLRQREGRAVDAVAPAHFLFPADHGFVVALAGDQRLAEGAYAKGFHRVAVGGLLDPGKPVLPAGGIGEGAPHEGAVRSQRLLDAIDLLGGLDEIEADRAQ